MTHPISDLDLLLATLTPTRNAGVYVYCCVPFEHDSQGLRVDLGLQPVVTVREQEGLTVVVEESQARRAGLTVLYRAAWITLTVHSDLHAVGLTAAVAAALAEEGLSCNVVAGAHHDHLFVPVDTADRAMHALRHLQEHATTGG